MPARFACDFAVKPARSAQRPRNSRAERGRSSKLRVVYRPTASRTPWPALLALALVACGDDDDATPIRRDSGLQETGPDASRGRDGGRQDAGNGEPAPACPSGECDLLDPGSCGAGEGCVFAHDNRSDETDQPALYCAPVGSAAEGEPCTASADCGPGLDCSAYDGTGRCRQYCCALSRTLDCPEDQFCRVGLDAERKSSVVGLCDRCDGCDPLDPAACGSGLSCYPLPGSIDCTACLPPGKAEPGDPCKLSTDCARGAACFRFDDDDQVCVEFCELDSDQPCSDQARRCSEVAGAKLPVGVALCL